jgi:predicted MarR family transcription regulator
VQAGKQEERVIDVRAVSMTQFELSLVVAYNAFSQWTIRCGTAVGAGRFSSLDLLVIGFLNAHDQTVRATDISFALKIEDNYTVQYSLKKLLAAKLVESQRNGKETLFSLTGKGRSLYADYAVVRSKFLLDAMSMLSKDGLDMDGLVGRLRAISGIYEQAARNAAWSSSPTTSMGADAHVLSTPSRKFGLRTVSSGRLKVAAPS